MDESYLAEAIHKEAYPRMHVLIISASASCLILGTVGSATPSCPYWGELQKHAGQALFTGAEEWPAIASW
jgi:hypothetical protein